LINAKFKYNTITKSLMESCNPHFEEKVKISKNIRVIIYTLMGLLGLITMIWGII